MKIVYITAGAAGMFCGSCMRDNTLVAALCRAGHDALLLPTYTPIRTDEEDVSSKRVFFGGINVYLEQKFSLFRHTPWFVDRLFNFPALLRWVSRFAMKTRAEDLGDLTVSMLQGEHGRQKKEITKLVRWLRDEAKPEVVNLTNALLSGMVHDLREALPDTRVVCSLQGDDIFTESLPPDHRAKCLDLIRKNARLFDGFISTSSYYADFMAGYFGVPREKIAVVYPGLKLAGHYAAPRDPARPFTLGYFARICPEKGFHQVVEAFVRLKSRPEGAGVKLRASGWLGDNNRAYFESQTRKLADAGVLGDFTHVESPDHASKIAFYHSIDVLSVPTVYREPKGLYVLEALANGVPVVQPAHGSFPELVEKTGGGLLVPPGDAEALAEAVLSLARDEEHRRELAERGTTAVMSRFDDATMAAETVKAYEALRR